jgi:hypothetical protein
VKEATRSGRERVVTRSEGRKIEERRGGEVTLLRGTEMKERRGGDDRVSFQGTGGGIGAGWLRGLWQNDVMSWKLTWIVSMFKE